MSRDELLYEVDALTAAARRRDRGAVRRHHDRVLELVEELLPIDRSVTVCAECGIGGGRHVEDCARGQLVIGASL